MRIIQLLITNRFYTYNHKKLQWFSFFSNTELLYTNEMKLTENIENNKIM